MDFDRERVGAVGLLTSGTEAGKYIKVVDDVDESGGILILTCRNHEFSGEIWDNWVGNWEELDEFFQVNEWRVSWPS